MTADEIALVTGGDRGLGRADALALAATGVDVILTCRSGRDPAGQVVADIAAMGREEQFDELLGVHFEGVFFLTQTLLPLIADGGSIATLESHAALGRAGEAEDVGDAIAALVSDANRWVTAQRIEISGGANL